MNIKGVMHMHSVHSYDGKMTLIELRDMLVARGISFCFMSEHTDKLTNEEAILFVQECKAHSTGSFVFIPGFEVPYTDAHILMYGTTVFLGQTADEVMLREWSTHSALIILAHPVRNHFVLDSVMEKVVDGIEIWNAQYDGKIVPRTRSVKLYEKLLKKNQQLLATGGLDFHRKEHFGAPVVTVDIGALTEHDIIHALKEGAYTFGSKTRSVSPRGLWRGKGGFLDRTLSFFSTATIRSGKLTNALLSKLGIKLPKKLAQAIRSKI